MLMENELKYLSDEELIKKGNTLNDKIVALSEEKDRSLKDKIRQYADQLYLIDCTLIERGYEQYLPLVEYYQNQVKREKEKIKSDSAAYVAIGFVIFTVTTIFSIGNGSTVFLSTLQMISILLIIRGGIRYSKKPTFYYTKK